MTKGKARPRSRNEERAIFAKGNRPRTEPRKVALARAPKQGTQAKPTGRGFGEIARQDGWSLQRTLEIGAQTGFDPKEVEFGWRERVLFTTGPHAEHKIVLVEDQRNAAQRLYEIIDSRDCRLALLGSEWASLAKLWEKERRRRGRDEDPDDTRRDTYPVKTMRDGKLITTGVTVPDEPPAKPVKPTYKVPEHWRTLKPVKLPKRQVRGVLLEQTEKNAYQFVVGKFDYHVRKEGRNWILDQFDAMVADADAAYRRSDSFPSLETALEHATDEDT